MPNEAEPPQSIIEKLGIPIADSAPPGWKQLADPVSIHETQVLESMWSTLRDVSVVTRRGIYLTFWRETPKKSYEQKGKRIYRAKP